MNQPPEFAPLPRVTHSDSGVWLEHVGLLDGDDAARLVGWLASAVKKHRRRKGTPIPTVSRIAGGVEVGGLAASTMAPRWRSRIDWPIASRRG